MIKKNVFIWTAVCALLGIFAAYGIWQDPRQAVRPVERNGSLSTVVRAGRPAAPPGAPPVDAVTYRPIPVATAQELNAAVPLASAGPPASPFTLSSGTQTWDRASHCLAQAVYYEAGSESEDGQRAVAQVVLNRVRSPAFPNSICGVVFQGAERTTGCQFTFVCDGSLRREPSSHEWRRAIAVANSALKGSVYAPVGNATHYHANYVLPYWAASMAKIREIGAHDFYRWPGSWRASTYFWQHYANGEPDEQIALATRAAAPELRTPGTITVLDSLAAGDKASANSALSGPVIDQKPHTLIVGEHKPQLNPGLDRTVILAADQKADKLAPVSSSGSHTH